MRNDNLKTGTSVVDISPAIGVELCGYAARSGGNTGIHDNLYAKTIAIDDGVTRAAILSCDLIGLDFEIVNYVKSEASKQLNIAPGSVLISCIHTHSGPVTMHGNAIGLKNKNYIEYLKQKLLESLIKAFENLISVYGYYYKGECNLGINRRGRIEEGSIEPTPDPAGFVDRQVSVIAFINIINDEPISILFNYGCHPVVLSSDNNLVSADFPGAACSYIEKSFNNNITSIFTNGGAGNVNPVLRGSFENLKINGEKLGEAVLEILKTKGRKLNPYLSFRNVEVDFPYACDNMKEEYLQTFNEYNKQLENVRTGSVEEMLCRANINWAQKYLGKIDEDYIPKGIQVTVQVLRIGDLYLTGIPAEVFAETSMWIKENSGADVIVLGYTNGNVGYLPPQAEILKGGYEVLEAHKYYDRPAHFSGMAEENARNASIRIISKMKENV